MLFVVSGHVWALKSNTRSNHHCGENCKNSGRFITVAWPYAIKHPASQNVSKHFSGSIRWFFLFRNIRPGAKIGPATAVSVGNRPSFSAHHGKLWHLDWAMVAGATGSLGCWAVSKQTRLSERISVYKPIRALEFRDGSKIYTSVI